MKKQKENSSQSEKEKDLPGDPVYSSREDIFSNEERETYAEEETPLDEDLDVPGAELDNADEIIGEEDEENNYYSLGGDDRNDLDEDEE